jgi:inosine-uridine nucleoside N-ribohydrolase
MTPSVNRSGRRPRRRGLLALAVPALAACCCLPAAAAQAGERPAQAPVPVIFDTDIGEDIDDLWALVYLLRSEEVDVKLVTTGFTLPMRKAQIAAKVLGRIGRTDVPIGAGVGRPDYNTNYRPWGKDFDLKKYKGKVHEDGVGELIKTVRADKTGRLRIVAVGPMQTLAEALKRDPSIAKKAVLVAMAGRFDHLDANGPSKPRGESNVRCKIPEAQRVFASPWKEVLIAPAESSSRVVLLDERYQHVLQSKDPGAETIIEVYKIWEKNHRDWHGSGYRSSRLYDTMAVRMAWDTSPFKLVTLPMRVTDKGCTVVDEDKGHRATVARAWVSDDALRDFKTQLVRRVTGSLPATGVRLGVADATASVNADQARRALVDGKLRRMDEGWSAQRTDKKPQWFQLELTRAAEVRMLKIAFAHGARWPERIEIRSSLDGERWQTLLETTHKTKTRKFKRFEVKPTRARYLRVIVKGHGTWHATIVKGVRVYGLGV